MGEKNIAAEILSKLNTTMASLWMAYLERDHMEKSTEWLEQVKNSQVEFVFPYRRETIAVLEWAERTDSHWKFKYYLGLIYWGKDRLAEAARLLSLCRSNPDEPVFYLSRSALLHEFDHTDQLQDLEKAMNLAPNDWRIWNYTISYYTANGNHQKELELAETAHKKWPDNYNLGLTYARSLLNNKQYDKCINQLKRINILPFEGAGASRVIYQNAYLGEALNMMDKRNYRKALSLLEEAKLWPERLGVGMPYTPDNRQIDYLQAVCYQKLNEPYNQEIFQNGLEDFVVADKDTIGYELLDRLLQYSKQ